MTVQSWRANLTALFDWRSSLSWLGRLVWYASGVVVSALAFYFSAMLVGHGALPLAGGVALCLGLAFITGASLGWRASKARLCRLGAVVALYLPLISAVLWTAALCQDLWRGDGLPGRSLSVMIRLPSHYSTMAVMACLALAIVAGGLLARTIWRRLQARRTEMTHSTTGVSP